MNLSNLREKRFSATNYANKREFLKPYSRKFVLFVAEIKRFNDVT